MLIILLICLLFGAVLGQRYKILALVPAMALAIPVAAVLIASTFWQIVGVALLTATALQIGYIAGASIRYLVAGARTRQINASPLAASPPPRHAAN